MDRLAVLNQCLGTMGEAPLNALTDEHPLRYAALQALDVENRLVQAKGRWYNLEDVTLTPSPADHKVYFGGDIIGFRNASRDVAKRGQVLYDLANQTTLFDDDFTVTGQQIRLVPFDLLPETAQQRIGWGAVVKFGMAYDGDSQKVGLAQKFLIDATVAENTDHIRNRRTNMITNNLALQRLKSVTRGARRLIRV